MSRSVILGEGFHDRSFWKGWLRKLGCFLVITSALAAHRERAGGLPHHLGAIDLIDLDIAGPGFAGAGRRRSRSYH